MLDYKRRPRHHAVNCGRTYAVSEGAWGEGLAQGNTRHDVHLTKGVASYSCLAGRVQLFPVCPKTHHHMVFSIPQQASKGHQPFAGRLESSKVESCVKQREVEASRYQMYGSFARSHADRYTCEPTAPNATVTSLTVCNGGSGQNHGNFLWADACMDR